MTASTPSRPTWPGVVTHYRPLLDIAPEADPITLLEGNTPLVPVPRLAGALAPGVGGDFELWLKYEGLNPTGSFKDRGMTAAITQAVHEGAQAVICASTGNTAASAAAYAARAGLRCIVIVPEGKIARGKLAGSLAYGADVVNISGNFDQGLDLVRQATEHLPVTLVNSINPYRLEGQQTAAFEIVDALGDAPDWLCLPVGNAGNITAYWMGFTRYHRLGNAQHTPQLLGVQAAGAAPIVRGRVVKKPETVATAIRIGNPARWHEAAQALDESGGHILAVEDAEILEAWHLLSSLEGVFVEPASAAGVAGLRRRIADGAMDVRGKRVVCVVTGHGLKDPETAIRSAVEPVTLKPSLDALAAYLHMP
jgi:threonine synthase